MSLAEATGTSGLAAITNGVLLCKIKTRASDHSDYAAYSVTVQVCGKSAEDACGGSSFARSPTPNALARHQ